MPAQIDTKKIAQLEKELKGSVLLSGTDEYRKATATFNAMGGDIRPKIVVQALNSDDIALALKFAKANSLPLRVRGGGYNAAFRSMCDGVMIDMQRIDHVVYHGDNTADVGAGCLIEAPTEKLAKHGQAFITGTHSYIGVAGLTLGGGMSFLSRKYGLASDQVIEFDVVLGDGSVVKASATENQDLFWGLRGGGGNFGVVTNFKVKTYPVEKVFGGIVSYTLDQNQMKEFVKAFGRSITKLKDDHNKVQMIYIVQQKMGNKIYVVHHVYCDATANNDISCLDDYRAFTESAHKRMKFKELSWTEMQRIVVEKAMHCPEQPVVGPPSRQYWSGGTTTALHPDYFDYLASTITEVDFKLYPNSFVFLEQWGGAINDESLGDCFFARGSEFTYVLVVASITRHDDKQRREHARAIAKKINSHPAGLRRTYVNFAADDQKTVEDVVDLYGGVDRLERAAKIKARVDPTSLFATCAVESH